MKPPPITPKQSRILTALIQELRPDWTKYEIESTLVECRDKGIHETTIAAVAASRSGLIRKPGQIPHDRRWWRQARDAADPQPEQPVDKGELCGICWRPELVCRAAPGGHEYERKASR